MNTQSLFPPLKRIFSFGVFFLVSIVSGFAVTIYYEKMGTVTATTAITTHESANGFDNDSLTMSNGGATTPGDLRNTSNRSTDGANDANIYLSSTSGDYGFSIEGIDASIYSGMSLSFYYRKESAGSLPTLAVEYWNGSAWVALTYSFSEAAGAGTGWYLVSGISLPVGAQHSTLKLRWVKSGTVAVRIDEVTLTGTFAGAPSTQASSVTFSSVSSTQMTVGWTNGNGSGRIVKMNTSNSFTSPTDLNDYVANSVYGGGEQVVYNGSSNTVTVTSLTPGTTYWYRVYEYNGSGSTKYYTTATATNNPNSQAALSGPTVASTNAGRLITETSARSGGNVSSDGGTTITERGIVYGTTTSPTTAGSKVTATGTTGTFTCDMSGLTRNTTYYVRAYATNASSTSYGPEITFTSAPLTATAATSPTATSFTAKWNAYPNATGYQLDVSTDENFGSFVSGYSAKAISGGSTTSDSVNGVSVDTIYYYRVRATIGAMIISEYVMGSSNNKYIEICNGTGATVDFTTSAYYILIYANGSATVSNSIQLTGTLANGAKYIVEHTSEALGVSANLSSGSLNFNGNDAVALARDSSGTTLVDVIGQIGTDPGTEWVNGSVSTLSKTLRRKSSITAGDTDGSNAFDPATEWDASAVDTASDLGSHTVTTLSGNSNTMATKIISVPANGDLYATSPFESLETINDVFGSSNASGLVAGTTYTTATQILLLNSDGSTDKTIFYDTADSRWEDATLSAIGTTTLSTGKAFILRNPNGSIDYIAFSGVKRTTQPTVTMNAAGSYTLVTHGRTSATAVSALNLNPGAVGGFKQGTVGTADKVIVVDSATGVATAYYNHATLGWRNGLSDASAVTIDSGKAFYIQRMSDSTFDNWTMPSE